MVAMRDLLAFILTGVQLPIRSRRLYASGPMLFVLTAFVLMLATSCRVVQPGWNSTAAVPEGKVLVASVQLRLNALGYDSGEVDGLMGQRTAAAISRFQRDNRMRVTGEIDEELYGRLDGELALADAVARVGSRTQPRETQTAAQPRFAPPPPVPASASLPPEPPDAQIDESAEPGPDAGAASPGPSGFAGRWAALGSDCGNPGTAVLADNLLRVGSTACAVASISPIGNAGTSWRVEASCPDKPDPVAFVLARVDTAENHRLSVTNMSDGSVALLEACST